MNRMKILRWLLLLMPAFLLFQACSPNPVYRMSPVSEKTSWLSGREYVTSERDSIHVVLAYYRHMGNLIYFDTEVVNLGSSTLHVAPEHFTSEAWDGHPGEVSGSVSGPGNAIRRTAVNPEDKLLELDFESSRVSADRRTSAGFDAAFLSLGLVSDMVAMADGAPASEMSWRASDRVDMAVEMEIRDERFRRSLDDLTEARNIWELDMLRKTDLRPDEYVRGMVAFPLRDSARFYDFILQTGGKEHRFRFEQFRFRP
jgi:hypothetical protein